MDEKTMDFYSEINIGTITDTIYTVSTEFPDRSVGSENGKGASEFLSEKLKEYGYTPNFQYFSAHPLSVPNKSRIVDTDSVVEGRNVIARLKDYDRSKKDVIFVAHYYSVIGTPGANDNASGVAVILEFARIMKGKDLNFNPVILFTDAEEANKIGAVTFINQLSDNEKENILTIITADMVAYGLNYETWNINEEYRDSIYNSRVRDKQRK